MPLTKDEMDFVLGLFERLPAQPSLVTKDEDYSPGWAERFIEFYYYKAAEDIHPIASPIKPIK